MSNEQLKLLSRMRKLITQGKRRFSLREDRDYVKALSELGITEEEAWNHILMLNKGFYIPDYKPTYAKTGESLTFKKKINDEIAYIKLKIEKNNNEEETVCLSFHKDIKK